MKSVPEWKKEAQGQVQGSSVIDVGEIDDVHKKGQMDVWEEMKFQR